MPRTRELAPFAVDAAASRGRLLPEPGAPERSPFQRDRDRVVHSTAFRRLKHKTQVFVYQEGGDHYRTRLTHSIEVAQIARSLARALGLDEDLTEAVALAHDFGHTPFGHAGEEALDLVMAEWGGFDHNAQTLRILTRLERRYAEFDGLNLTWEALEGVVKHNGPFLAPDGAPRRPVPLPIADFDARWPLALDSWPSAEAQVAAIADDIAYDCHDLDDGLRAGFFDVADLELLPLAGPIISELHGRYPGLDRPRLIHETVRRMIDAMARDCIAETRHRAEEARPASADSVRRLGRPLVAFSPAMAASDRALKDFLMQRMYRHWRVNRMASKAKRVVTELFELLLGEPNLLPPEWAALTDAPGTARCARTVADYIAGMTDRFALDEHFRLFDRYSKP